MLQFRLIFPLLLPQSRRILATQRHDATTTAYATLMAVPEFVGLQRNDRQRHQMNNPYRVHSPTIESIASYFREGVSRKFRSSKSAANSTAHSGSIAAAALIGGLLRKPDGRRSLPSGEKNTGVRTTAISLSRPVS